MKVPLLRSFPRLWLLALVGAVPLHAEPTALEAVEKSAGDWVRVRAETARLETEWDTTRSLLESTVNGLQERAQALEAKRDFLKAKTAKDREELATLEAANKASATGLQAVNAQLKAMSARLFGLRASLPPRLSEALEMAYKSLAAPDLTVSERMQLTMTVLNRGTQFNRSITCEDEILTLGEGKKAQQLEVIYWGLSFGYALDRPAHQVWFGSPGPERWRWEPVPDAFDRVARLVAIYRGRSEPEFVDVPARLKIHSPESSMK
jgi:hypothetical protein